jgi:hypothetical protein
MSQESRTATESATERAAERVQLREEVRRLRKALREIMEKAGSNTVSLGAMQRGVEDTGFAGIFAVAKIALTPAPPFDKEHHEDGLAAANRRLRERVRALEVALRLWSSGEAMIRPDIWTITNATLTPAPPAITVCSACNGSGEGDGDKRCHQCAPPAETPAPVKWEADHMGLCDHGVNHRGNHACDGCCKKAETPAPTCIHCDAQPGFNGHMSSAGFECHPCWDKRLARDASVDALSELSKIAGELHMVPEIDRLKAELAAEKKRADEWQQAAHECNQRNEKRKAELESAHAATTAKLGRAVVALRSSRQNVARFLVTEIDSILTDADSKAAGEAWREGNEDIKQARNLIEGVTHNLRYEQYADSLRTALTLLSNVEGRRKQSGGR